jgi:YHS domain-containing protein
METDKIGPNPPDPFSTLTDQPIAVRGRHALESAWNQGRVWWSRLSRPQQFLIGGCVVFALLLVQANVAKVAHRLAHWMRGAGSNVPDQKVLTLLECPVCHQPVDPKASEFIADVGKKHIYFDRMECLEAFQANPTRYAHVKYHVRINPNDSAGDAAGEAAPITRIPPPDATEDQPMPTQNTERAPAVVDPPPQADVPPPRATRHRGPVGDGPLELPPDPPPDSGPAPVPESVSGAPSVDEPAPPSDVPMRAPRHLPDYDADGAAPPPRPSRKHTSSAPRLDSLPDGSVPPPPAAKGMPAPDDNGFALPPDVNEAPPPRKKSARRSHAPAPPASDAPPSVDEPQP